MCEYLAYLGFTNSDSDKLGTHVGKESEDEGVDESKESTETNVVHNLVWLESSSICPVPETDSLLAWDTSEVDDETEENETSEGDDLDEGEPEFDLSEPLDTETIDSDDKLQEVSGHVTEFEVTLTYCDEDSDPSGTVDALVPESDDKGTSDNLGRTDDEVFAQVD